MLKNRTKYLVVTVIMLSLLTALVITGCSSSGKTSSQSAPQTGPTKPLGSLSGQTQSSSGGSVTLEAKLLGHQGDSLVFEIAMNTHSVNLDGYDLRQLALLRDDKDVEYRPVEWSAASGGHHRSGKLVFTHPDQSVKTLELVIRNVAGVKERILRWSGVTG